MSESKKINILTEILGDYVSSGKEKLFFCPFCNHHKPKLSINIDKNVGKCWACDWSTPNLVRIVRKLGNFNQINEWNTLSGIIEIQDYEKIFSLNKEEQEIPQILSLPDEFKPLCTKRVEIGSYEARRYLKDRGITKEDIAFWKIGYATTGLYEDRVIIPSFNNDGKVNYYVGRRYDGNDWRKYENPEVSKDLIFNELYLDWTEDVSIVEGVFDAIKAKNAIPLLGSTIRENSKLFQEIIKKDPTIYLALDPDAEKKAERLIEDLLNYGAELYKVPIPAGIDVGDMTHEEYLEHKENSVLIKNRDYLLMNHIMSL